MKTRGNLLFLLAIMVAMLVIIGLSLRLEYLFSKLLPLLFSGIVLILVGIELGKEFRKKVDGLILRPYGYVIQLIVIEAG